MNELDLQSWKDSRCTYQSEAAWQVAKPRLTEIKTGENMSNTRLEEIKIQIAKLEDEKKAIESRKFEVCKDGWVIQDNSRKFYSQCKNDELIAGRGRVFKTDEIAEKVDKLINPSYMIAQFVFDRCPDWMPKEDEMICHINYKIKDQSYGIVACNGMYSIGSIPMPQKVAQELVELLNNGEYKL